MDRVDTLHGSRIQHGPHSDRIYLMRLGDGGVPELIGALDRLARARGYGKIFAKVPETAWPAFGAAGYAVEAVVPGLFGGETTGFFIAKYIAPERRRASDLRSLPLRARGSRQSCRGAGAVGACRPSDATAMSRLYRSVFPTYPFPIQDAGYLRRMMGTGVLWYGIRVAGRLAALAAAEIDREHRNAEMTDFATLPQWRGMGFAGRLLRRLEAAARRLDVATAYTIARAVSPGMNAVFSAAGYFYGGLLPNNTQIGGRIQSMAVWYKPL